MALDPNQIQSSQQPATSGTSSPTQPQDDQGRARQTGTGFTNLSKIIGANQNNGLASAVAGGVSNQVNQAKSGIQSGLQDFSTQANANNVATDANKQQEQTIINDPTQATDQDASKFATFRSGAYNGPTQLANKDQLTNQASQAATLGQMAGTTEGRQGLLQRFVGGAGYNQGKQRLDSLILGQSGTPQLTSAYRDASGLNQQVNTANTTAQEQAKSIAAQNADFANKTKTDLGNGVNQIYNTGSTAMADWTKNQNDLISGITTAGAFDPNNANAGINLSSDQYNALVKGGYDPSGENSYMYNQNLGDLISKSGFNPTLNSALTSQDAAKAQALAKLYGSDINENGKNLLSNIADTSQLGTLATANKINYGADQAAQGKIDAQENLLKSYYNGYVAPNASPLASWDKVNANEFLDNIQNKGLLYARVNPQEALGGNLNGNEFDTTSTGHLLAQGKDTASGLDAPNGEHTQMVSDARQMGDTYNTGANYADKSNLEKAIDALRAGDIGYHGDTSVNGYDGTVASTGNGHWVYPTSGAFLPSMGMQSQPHYDPGRHVELQGSLTGAGMQQYADKFGRLRQLMNPNPPTVNDTIAAKLANSGGAV